MNGGIDYSNLTCNHHQDQEVECNCVQQSVDMVMCPDNYPNMRHFVACMEVAFEHEGIRLRNYVSDLITIDRLTLEKEDPSLPFVFAVRESGTHLFRLSERDGVGHRSWEYPSFIGTSFACESVRWFWWDGEKMVRLSDFVEAGKRLRDACRERGLDKW